MNVKIIFNEGKKNAISREDKISNSVLGWLQHIQSGLNGFFKGVGRWVLIQLYMARLTFMGDYACITSLSKAKIRICVNQFHLPMFVLLLVEYCMAINYMNWTSMHIKLKGLSAVQWNLSWETTAMTDHLSRRTTKSCQKVPHFSATEPVTKGHLPWETIFLWWIGEVFQDSSSTVSLML